MRKESFQTTVQALIHNGRGILDVSQNNETMKKRFAVAKNARAGKEEARDFRRSVVGNPNTYNYLGGFVLSKDATRETLKSGKPLVQSIKEAGQISVLHVNENINEVPQRILTKVQAVRKNGTIEVPSNSKERGVTLNSSLKSKELADFALKAQMNGKVPIIEAEVSSKGSHTVNQSYDAHARFYEILFSALEERQVYMGGLILGASLVRGGTWSGLQNIPEEIIGNRNVDIANNYVPGDIGGIVRLSSAQSPIEATMSLQAMNSQEYTGHNMSFLYGRAILDDVIYPFAKNDHSLADANYMDALHANHSAALGVWKPSIDNRIPDQTEVEEIYDY